MAELEPLSENVEEYLETIFRIQLKGRVAKTGEIAEHLGLSPPSVTEMTKRLEEMGYVEYRPYQGVTLTKKGHAHAYLLLRKHRVVQEFLVQVLGMPKDDAHEWGCKLEHVVPVELERYLYDQLPDKDLKGLDPPPGPGDDAGPEQQAARAAPQRERSRPATRHNA